MQRADLTGAERNPSRPPLSGLRPLMDMPDWGYEADPDSPIPEQHHRDLFCDPWETVERPAETTFARVINSCNADAVPFANAADQAAVETGSVPVKCVQGLHGDTVGGTNEVALYLPFKIDLPRDMDLCEDQTGAQVTASAKRRLLELTELALLRQLWQSSVEPRSTNLGRNAQLIGGTTALPPHEAYGLLVEEMEETDHLGWTLAVPRKANSILAEQSIIRPDGNGWLDANDQPVISGGQRRGWLPTHADGDVAVAATQGEGYLVACGPVWFALESITNAITGGTRPLVDEVLASQVSTRPQVRGFVMTRTTEIFSVLADLAG